MNDHHDSQLCRRLAEKVMGWHRHEEWWYSGFKCVGEEIEPMCMNVSITKNWDPCCNPVHSWMLEQKMAELGWRYNWTLESAEFLNGPIMTGANRLHATSLAADAAVK